MTSKQPETDPLLEFAEVVVDDAATTDAEQIVRVLVAQHGLGGATARLVSATEQLLSGVLHLRSPLWEQNAVNVGNLCATLTANVLQHRDCARDVNAAGDTAMVKH